MSEQPIEVSFPGGRKVDVSIGGFTVHTDQSVKSGGEGTAPEPGSLFLASIAACGGFYALAFCEKRSIDTQGLSLRMDLDMGDKGKVKGVTLALTLPEGFPDKYRDAVVRAVDLCWVKKQIVDPPVFAVVVE